MFGASQSYVACWDMQTFKKKGEIKGSMLK